MSSKQRQKVSEPVNELSKIARDLAWQNQSLSGERSIASRRLVRPVCVLRRFLKPHDDPFAERCQCGSNLLWFRALLGTEHSVDNSFALRRSVGSPQMYRLCPMNRLHSQPWLVRDDSQQRRCRSGWLTPRLLPVLNGLHADAD